MNEVPFSMRRFTLDGEPCNIEDFIASNATDWQDARLLREELAALEVDYHMYFRFDGSPTEREVYRLA